MTDTTFSLVALTDLEAVTGGGKIGTAWKIIKKVGGKAVDAAKDAWKATPAPVKAALATGGVPAALGAGTAYLHHKLDD